VRRIELVARAIRGDRAGRLQTENAVILHQHDLTLRPITGPDELDLFNSLPYVLNDEVGGDLAAGRRRPEWLWLALRGDRVVARAGWWSRPGDRHPLVMDIFDIDGGAEDGVQLLKTALPAVVPADATPPEYSRFLPADWRDDQHTRQAVHDRMGVLERTGAKLFIERLRLEWRPGTPVAGPGGRLTFRPVRNPDELIELMTLVLDGTLDAHSRDDLTRMTPRQAAQEQYHHELERYASPHEWRRIATLPDGEPVGFVIPHIMGTTRSSPTSEWYRHIGAMAIFTTSLPRVRACSQPRTFRGSGPPPTSVTHQWRRPSPGPATSPSSARSI
jgi:hypothetical protein